MEAHEELTNPPVHAAPAVQAQQPTQRRVGCCSSTWPLMLGNAFHWLVSESQCTPAYWEVRAPGGGGEASSGSRVKAGALGSLLGAVCTHRARLGVPAARPVRAQ